MKMFWWLLTKIETRSPGKLTLRLLLILLKIYSHFSICFCSCRPHSLSMSSVSSGFKLSKETIE